MREHLCFFSLFVLTELVICPSAEPEEEHEGKILYFNVDVNNTESVLYIQEAPICPISRD